MYCTCACVYVHSQSPHVLTKTDLPELPEGLPLSLLIKCHPLVGIRYLALFEKYIDDGRYASPAQSQVNIGSEQRLKCSDVYVKIARHYGVELEVEREIAEPSVAPVWSKPEEEKRISAMHMSPNLIGITPMIKAKSDALSMSQPDFHLDFKKGSSIPNHELGPSQPVSMQTSPIPDELIMPGNVWEGKQSLATAVRQEDGMNVGQANNELLLLSNKRSNEHSKDKDKNKDKDKMITNHSPVPAAIIFIKPAAFPPQGERSVLIDIASDISVPTTTMIAAPETNKLDPDQNVTIGMTMMTMTATNASAATMIEGSDETVDGHKI
ncbi:hypothetical protein RFI_18427, partial [Reticulomyxa filosa]